jgi:tRNA 2-thiouridine synthesizing protein A
VRLDTPTPHKSIDLTGLRCPHLVTTTVKTIRQLDPGQILQVITTDLNSPSNMSAWSRQSGNPLIDMYDEDDRFVFYFRRRLEVNDASEQLTGFATPL